MPESPTAAPPLPPRVLVVMPAQWPRAHLRAALREAGYDAVGTRTLDDALRIRVTQPDRGAVRLVVVDQPALGGAEHDEQLGELLARHGAPATLLLAQAMLETPAGPWRQVLRRPVSIADVVRAVEALLPLPAPDRHPLD